MPMGPNGERRPADSTGTSVMVAKIAMGEIKDNKNSNRTKSGKSGAKARAKKLTLEGRSLIARKPATDRWANDR